MAVSELIHESRPEGVPVAVAVLVVVVVPAVVVVGVVAVTTMRGRQCYHAISSLRKILTCTIDLP